MADNVRHFTDISPLYQCPFRSLSLLSRLSLHLHHLSLSDYLPLHIAILSPLAPITQPFSGILRVSCSTNEPLKVMISGAPAYGKGSQCELIFGSLHIST